MLSGEVVAIYIGAKDAGPLHAVERVKAVAGRGLQGDRYFEKAGTFSHRLGPDQEVTLIESEAIEAMTRDYEMTLPAGEMRRNIVTRGVALNHLVGREFTVGGARLRGIRLCEPCGHLEKLTIKGVQKAMRHRGGLRAQVLQDGDIAVGDLLNELAVAGVS